jgi:hypothetical protein
MLIPINADYRITSDAYNVTVERRRVTAEGENAGKEYWQSVGHYRNLERALMGMVNDGIQSRDLQGVSAIMAYLTVIHQDILRALEEKWQQSGLKSGTDTRSQDK